MRDGTRIEANPLGAPDDAHLAISVGGMNGHDRTIVRAELALMALLFPSISWAFILAARRRDCKRTGTFTALRVVEREE